ncbi:MAG TPA: hypothetical protein PKW35_22475, partial [Nannocystaceae bacterium]|nr:hypothetical protein [Nannocystaceae bacterium]
MGRSHEIIRPRGYTRSPAAAREPATDLRCVVAEPPRATGLADLHVELAEVVRDAREKLSMTDANEHAERLLIERERVAEAPAQVREDG